MTKTKILAVVGPTASGKSALALALAERYGGEIVSCDSMQVYRGMDIGTAKPSKEEQARVRHHLIDVVEPTDPYSCADFVEAASLAIEDITSRGALPIVCGGTGLYLDALLRSPTLHEGAPSEELRQELFLRLEREGIDAIYAELRRVDPESADAIHPNNQKRVIRALEIYYATGIPKSELDRRSREVEPRYDATVLGLRYPTRSILWERIETRVDRMMEEGLLEETEELWKRGIFEKNHTAAQAIGYKELLCVLRGEAPLSEGVEMLKTGTRRYAKRQMTWFGSKPYVRWLCAENEGRLKSFEEIVNNASEAFI